MRVFVRKFSSSCATAARRVVTNHEEPLSKPLTEKISSSTDEITEHLSSTPTKRPVLEDSFSRFHSYLRISLTERCNLRCQYCMPEEGVELSPSSQLLTSDEIIKLAEIFVKNGVEKIRLTGGEPTVRKDIESIIANLSSLRPLGLSTLAMTTNGIKLKDKVEAFRRGGLDVLNVSLDTLVPAKFVMMTRRKGLERVLEGIDRAIDHGYKPKINTVVMRGTNDDEVVDLVEMARHKPLEIRFIEYMPFDGNRWSSRTMVPYKELIDKIEFHYNRPLRRIQDGPHDTTKHYTMDGFTGSIGFISSMSDHFCSSCNRIRLTADGNLKVCLFGNSEVNLRDALRQGATFDEMSNLISAGILRKKKQHAGMEILSTMKNRPMITIGG